METNDQPLNVRDLIPTKKEWTDAGFTVPAELCADKTNGSEPPPTRHKIESDSSAETVPPVADLRQAPLIDLPKAFPPFKLMATIKKSSKYYRQGLIDPTDRKSKPQAFPVETIIAWDGESHDFRLNNNQYRREDLNFWIQVGKRLKRL